MPPKGPPKRTPPPKKPPPPKTTPPPADSYGLFARAVLRAIGAPVTAANLNWLLHWMAKEQGTGAYNPLGTSVPTPGSGYASFAAGVAGTAKFIENGNYAAILQGLRQNNISFSAAVGQDLKTWSNNGHTFYTSFDMSRSTSTIASTVLGQAVGGGGGGGDIQSIIDSFTGGGKGGSVKDYLDWLTGQGVSITPAAHAFAVLAHNSKWSTAEADYALLHEPWFGQQFPGIFDAGGRLLMSPSAYEGEYKRYQAIASQFGQTLTRGQFGYALAKNVDSTTFGNKLQAIQTVKSNQADFQQFEETLKARGLLPRGGLKPNDLYKFVLGEGPKVWNQVWEEAYMRTAAANAGLTVGSDITRGMVNTLIKQHPELYTTIQGGGSQAILDKWMKLAQDLKTTAPASRLYGMGLTAADLAQLEFGGPHAADIATRAQQALDNLKASQQNQASESLGALAQRVGSATANNATAGVQSPFPTP